MDALRWVRPPVFEAVASADSATLAYTHFAPPGRIERPQPSFVGSALGPPVEAMRTYVPALQQARRRA